jgi:hypothetical protein
MLAHSLGSAIAVLRAAKQAGAQYGSLMPSQFLGSAESARS